MNRTGTTILTALEIAWDAIRKQHPDVPNAVIVIGPGSNRGKGMKLGHYAHDRWSVRKSAKGQGAPMSEVLIGGEGLQRGAEDVMETLLHEAAHGLAATRGLKDTSREGKYHNKTFARLADEMGLDAVKQGNIGLAHTTMRPETIKHWRAEIATLSKALRGYRMADAAGQKKQSTRLLLAECDCGTKIRLSTAAFEAAPITCGACNADFQVQE